MGGAQSIPQSLPSSQTYKGKVGSTQIVVNQIFTWMMSQIDTNDLLKLANPKYCKDYVFLTQESLKSFMRSIQLQPKLGPKNVLYFETVKRMTFADDQAEKENPALKQYRDSLCRQLAFFYVRIFQIFGAMALTVIDSLPDIEPGVRDVRQAAIAYGKAQRPPPLFYGRGGGKQATDRADGDTLGDFAKYARKFFYQVDGEEGQTYGILPGITASSKIQPGVLKTIFFTPSDDSDAGAIFYSYTTTDNVGATISIVNPRKDEYTLVIENINLSLAKGDDDTSGLRYVIPMVFKNNEYRYQGGTKNFYQVLLTILEKLVRSKERTKSLDELLLDQKGERQAVGRAEERVDEQGIPEGLSYLKIREYLEKKPKAYCVARAIQLLSPTLIDQLRREVPFESDICFTDNPPAFMKDSVPLYGSAITVNSPGLRALNQLFYDMLEGGAPKISAETKPKYQKFVDLMQIIFSPEAPTKQVGSIDKVQSVQLEGCKQFPNKRIFLSTKNSIREVQKSVAALLNYQMRHTATVMKFLTKLFVFTPTGQIRGIHPDILKGGIPYVNRLAEEARSILTEYYKYCEGTYRLGALQVLASQGKVAQDRI